MYKLIQIISGLDDKAFFFLYGGTLCTYPVKIFTINVQINNNNTIKYN